MKNIYKIVYILIFLSLPAFGMTSEEFIKLDAEASGICNYYNKTCSIAYIDSSRQQGYITRQNIITITTGLTDKLTFNETRAVVLHEVGHCVLEHYKRTDEFMKDWNLFSGTLKTFRHKMETEADLFATAYFLYNKEYNYLPEALLKLTSKDLTASSTHPSTPDRIFKIKQLTKEIKINAGLRTSL